LKFKEKNDYLPAFINHNIAKLRRTTAIINPIIRKIGFNINPRCHKIRITRKIIIKNKLTKNKIFAFIIS
jgi:hypothetical protein